MPARTRRTAPFALVVALLALGGVAAADPPPDVAYQGLLLDATDVPLAGPANLQFRIFDQPNGGFDNTAADQALSVSGGAGRTAPALNNWVGGGLFQAN